MIPRPSPFAAFGPIMQASMKTIVLELSVQQQSGRWT
jgi:hypothetical protein